MGLFSRFKQPTSAPPSADVLRLKLSAGTFEFESDDEEVIRGRGLEMQDQASGALIHDDDPRLRDAGVFVTKVAGVSRRMRELQRDSFRPLEPLLLRREPENPHDANAIAVFDRKGRTTIGYVPREDAGAIAEMIDSGTEVECLCFWEWRDGGDRRCGLKILVAPRGVIELH